MISNVEISQTLVSDDQESPVKFVVVASTTSVTQSDGQYKQDAVSYSKSETTFSVSAQTPLRESSIQCLGQFVLHTPPRVQVGASQEIANAVRGSLINIPSSPLTGFRAMPTWTELQSEAIALIHMQAHLRSGPGGPPGRRQVMHSEKDLAQIREEIGRAVESNFNVGLLYASFRSMGLKKTLPTAMRKVLLWSRNSEVSSLAGSEQFQKRLKSLVQNARNKNEIAAGVLSSTSKQSAWKESQRPESEVDFWQVWGRSRAE